MAKQPKIIGPRPIVRGVKKPVAKPADQASAKPAPPAANTPANPPAPAQPVSSPAPEQKISTPVQNGAQTVASSPAPAPAVSTSTAAPAQTPASAPVASAPSASVAAPVSPAPQATVQAPAAPVTQPSAKPGDKKTEPAGKKTEKENNRKAKPEPKPKKEKAQGGGGATVFLTIVVFGLLGVIGYLLYDKFEQKNVLVQTKEQAAQNEETYKNDIERRVAVISKLQDSIKAVIAEKEKLGQELEDERAKLAELENLKRQVRNKQISINNLNRTLSKYKQEYATVQASVGELLAENERLVAEKVRMDSVIRSKDSTLQSIAAVQASLAEKVSVASALKAENIDVIVYNTGGKEMKGNIRAMLVGNIKMAVQLGENKITEPGEKEMYMRVVEPSGNVLFTGSKKFVVNGKETPYTDKQTFNYSNNKPTVSFLYTKGSRYIPGKYRIEFYVEGKKVGDTEVTFSR